MNAHNIEAAIEMPEAWVCLQEECCCAPEFALFARRHRIKRRTKCVVAAKSDFDEYQRLLACSHYEIDFTKFTGKVLI